MIEALDEGTLYQRITRHLPERARTVPVMQNGYVVSVVDDDESVRQAIDGLLRSVGLQVAMFASAEEFLQSDGRGFTDCLVLDLGMPDMDGFELQQKLTDDGHLIPMVILTAHGDSEARKRALRAGASAVLQKPFDGDVLLAAIEAARNRR
jgi:FixJ family two-component response regulator